MVLSPRRSTFDWFVHGPVGGGGHTPGQGPPCGGIGCNIGARDLGGGGGLTCMVKLDIYIFIFNFQIHDFDGKFY